MYIIYIYCLDELKEVKMDDDEVSSSWWSWRPTSEKLLEVAEKKMFQGIILIFLCSIILFRSFVISVLGVHL